MKKLLLNQIVKTLIRRIFKLYDWVTWLFFMYFCMASYIQTSCLNWPLNDISLQYRPRYSIKSFIKTNKMNGKWFQDVCIDWLLTCGGNILIKVLYVQKRPLCFEVLSPRLSIDMQSESWKLDPAAPLRIRDLGVTRQWNPVDPSLAQQRKVFVPPQSSSCWRTIPICSVLRVNVGKRYESLSLILFWTSVTLVNWDNFSG